ncbi:MAG: hypothetical protein ACE5HO_18860 [bacterium]
MMYYGLIYDPKSPRRLDFDKQKYQQALREAEALRPDFRCAIDKLYLVKLADDFSGIVCSRDLQL